MLTLPFAVMVFMIGGIMGCGARCEMVQSIAITGLPLQAVENAALNFHLRKNPAFRF
jgi:hypothetical protein